MEGGRGGSGRLRFGVGEGETLVGSSLRQERGNEGTQLGELLTLTKHRPCLNI